MGILPPFKLDQVSLPISWEILADVLGKIHDLETLAANHCQLVLEEMHVERFGRDEEIFVQPEPLCPLTEKVTKGPSLTSSILCVPSQNRFEHAEEGVHLPAQLDSNNNEHLHPSSSYRGQAYAHSADRQ